HDVEVPELHVAVPSDIRGCENKDAAGEVESDAEVASVEAVDENAAEKRNEQAGGGDDDDLQADFHSGVRASEDEPTYSHEVHAAAEEGNEHGHEKITEAALGPDKGPVDTRRSGSGSSCHDGDGNILAGLKKCAKVRGRKSKQESLGSPNALI